MQAIPPVYNATLLLSTDHFMLAAGGHATLNSVGSSGRPFEAVTPDCQRSVERYEKNVSAQQHQAQARPWLSCAHVHPWRTQCTQGPACQGPRPAFAVDRVPGRVRFSKRSRLINAHQYGRVFARGRRLGERQFLAIAAANNLPVARLGLAVSRKTAHRAVDRNRLKRLVRESFRHHQEELEGLDVVVIARHGAKALDNASITTILDRLWQRVSKACELC